MMGLIKVALNANKRAFREHFYDELLMRSDGDFFCVLVIIMLFSPNVSMDMVFFDIWMVLCSVTLIFFIL